MRRGLAFPPLLLALAGCSSGGTVTTVQVTTTVEAAPTVAATTVPELPSTDPDDVGGLLDVRNFNATRTGDLPPYR